MVDIVTHGLAPHASTRWSVRSDPSRHFISEPPHQFLFESTQRRHHRPALDITPQISNIEPSLLPPSYRPRLHRHLPSHPARRYTVFDPFSPPLQLTNAAWEGSPLCYSCSRKQPRSDLHWQLSDLV